MYDGDAILLEYDGGNALQARYAHGEEIDQPLAMTRGGRPSGRLTRRHRRHGPPELYGVDHLGSVRVLTDAAGAVANRYDYDAFGNQEATSYETVTNPFGFTARERDAESGLMFYRARYYDPKIGRFISEDPIGFEGKDLNLYRYIFNGPTMYTDPFGNVPWYGNASSAVAASLAGGLVFILYDMWRDLKNRYPRPLSEAGKTEHCDSWGEFGEAAAFRLEAYAVVAAGVYSKDWRVGATAFLGVVLAETFLKVSERVGEVAEAVCPLDDPYTPPPWNPV